MRTPAILGALLLLAVLVLVSWPEGDQPSAHVSRPDPKAPIAPRLEGRVDARSAEAQETAPPDEKTEDEPVRVVLVGEALLEPGGSHASIDLRWAGVELADGGVFFVSELTSQRFEPGLFVLDVTDQLAGARRLEGAVALRLEARAKGYVAFHTQIPIPEPGSPPERVSFTLARTVAIDGIVLDEHGHPRAEATVMLYAMGRDGPEPLPVSAAVTAEDGRFHLSGGGRGRHLLVAAWQLDRMVEEGRMVRPLPASTLIDLRAGEPVDGISLRLRASQSVGGVVRVDGRPQRSAFLGCRPRGENRGLAWAGRESWADSALLWLDGQAHWGDYRVWTDEDGRFEIVGLAPVPHEVCVKFAEGLVLHPVARAQTSVSTTPTADDLELEVTTSSLVVRVRVDGEPPEPGCCVLLSSVGMDPDLPPGAVWGTTRGETDEAGLCAFHVTPRHTYVVRVVKAGLDTFTHEVTTPAAGQSTTIDADLVPLAHKPRLIVAFEGEGVEGLEEAAFGFYLPEVGPLSQTPWPMGNAEVSNARCVVEGLVPGTYRLHVRPGRTWHEPPNEWLESVLEVEVPPAGEARIAVPVARGGRLVVDVTDVDGRHLEGTCSVRDEAGLDVPAWFKVRAGQGWTVAANALPGGGPASLDRALPEGTYEVTVIVEGFEPATREVAIRTGRITPLRLVLRRP